MTDPARFELLGAVRAFRNGHQLDLGPAKQRAVLAVLLLNLGRPVPTHRIVDAVWGDDPPENGPNVVQKYVAGLRRVLDPDRTPRTPGELLALTDGGYVLSTGALDTEEFRNGLARADAERRAGHLEEAARVARTALDLWRGEALGGLTGPIFEAARTRLHEERAGAWELWAEIELSRGGFAGLVTELSRLVEEFPLREGLRAQLMIALYRSGRQAEALATFRDAREYFLDELGAEPGERLQETHRRILRNEPPAAPAPEPAPVARPVSPPPVPERPWSPAPALPSWGHGVPLGPRRAENVWAETILAALVPLMTCSLGSWGYFVYATVQRRTARELITAIGYLFAVLAVVALWLVDPSAPNADIISDAEAFGIILAFLVTVLASVHGAVLAHHPGDSAHARRQRRMARQYTAFNPAAARHHAIGRPDLARGYDDGGLIDLNHAPEQVIAGLPGINPIEAHRIAVDRYENGPYQNPDDLVRRGLVTPRAVRRLESWLICVPPALS
ncbi:BTAD domain-containing putative transcriptional regulator [Actinoplanes couchii]|uniref:BTAD domain-containing putative transcriptional regulator n=1 Tax=Actinoplanes couchii TaxID=403638 RepID=UPI001940D259|nr:BTAD domain-containing putative transcriptional regulator [Actinoplanes couchii]MDR6323185.1 DNA-binding SARP family transcriptional activator [Actinoplanes couchii]